MKFFCPDTENRCAGPAHPRWENTTMTENINQTSVDKRPLPRLAAGLEVLLTVLAVLWLVAMLAYAAYIILVLGGFNNAPAWATNLLGGGFIILGFASTIFGAWKDKWQYGHWTFGRGMLLMAWMLFIGAYGGIQLSAKLDYLSETEKVLIVHGVNSLVEKAGDDRERLEFWCAERVRYEQEFRGRILPSMPETCAPWQRKDTTD